MVLGVMEGQIRGGYFPDYILDPSVIDCIVHTGHKCIGGISSKIGGISGKNRGQNWPKIQNLLFLPRLIIHPKLQIITPDEMVRNDLSFDQNRYKFWPELNSVLK